MGFKDNLFSDQVYEDSGKGIGTKTDDKADGSAGTDETQESSSSESSNSTQPSNDGGNVSGTTSQLAGDTSKDIQQNNEKLEAASKSSANISSANITTASNTDKLKSMYNTVSKKDFLELKTKNLFDSLKDSISNGATNALDKISGFINDSMNLLLGSTGEFGKTLMAISNSFLGQLKDKILGALFSNIVIPERVYLAGLQALELIKSNPAYKNNYIRKMCLKKDLALCVEWLDKILGIHYSNDKMVGIGEAISAADRGCCRVAFYIMRQLKSEGNELDLAVKQLQDRDPKDKLLKSAEKLSFKCRENLHNICKHIIIGSYSNLMVNGEISVQSALNVTSEATAILAGSPAPTLKQIVNHCNIHPSAFGTNDKEFGKKFTIKKGDLDKCAPFFKPDKSKSKLEKTQDKTTGETIYKKNGKIVSKADYDWAEKQNASATGSTIKDYEQIEDTRLVKLPDAPKFIAPRNFNIKKIYLYLSDKSIHGDYYMYNKDMYERLKYPIYSTLISSLDKALSGLFQTGIAKSLLKGMKDIESAMYDYTISVEKFLYDPSKSSFLSVNDMTTLPEPTTPPPEPTKQRPDAQDLAKKNEENKKNSGNNKTNSGSNSGSDSSNGSGNTGGGSSSGGSDGSGSGNTGGSNGSSSNNGINGEYDSDGLGLGMNPVDTTEQVNNSNRNDAGIKEVPYNGPNGDPPPEGEYFNQEKYDELLNTLGIEEAEKYRKQCEAFEEYMNRPEFNLAEYQRILDEEGAEAAEAYRKSTRINRDLQLSKVKIKSYNGPNGIEYPDITGNYSNEVFNTLLQNSTLTIATDYKNTYNKENLDKYGIFNQTIYNKIKEFIDTDTADIYNEDCRLISEYLELPLFDYIYYLDLKKSQGIDIAEAYRLTTRYNKNLELAFDSDFPYDGPNGPKPPDIGNYNEELYLEILNHANYGEITANKYKDIFYNKNIYYDENVFQAIKELRGDIEAGLYKNNVDNYNTFMERPVFDKEMYDYLLKTQGKTVADAYLNSTRYNEDLANSGGNGTISGKPNEPNRGPSLDDIDIDDPRAREEMLNEYYGYIKSRIVLWYIGFTPKID
jgi:hypothetical protein